MQKALDKAIKRDEKVKKLVQRRTEALSAAERYIEKLAEKAKEK
jgi:hypothetical protein